MLARGVSRRNKVQPIFGYENPTAHVLLHRVSHSLRSIRGSGDENGAYDCVANENHAESKVFVKIFQKLDCDPILNKDVSCSHSMNLSLRSF